MNSLDKSIGKTRPSHIKRLGDIAPPLRLWPTTYTRVLILFLLRFIVFYRCPEFIPPSYAFVAKTSNGLRVTCSNKTESNWLLQCIDGRWMTDTFKNCDYLISTESNVSSSDHGSTNMSAAKLI